MTFKGRPSEIFNLPTNCGPEFNKLKLQKAGKAGKNSKIYFYSFTNLFTPMTTFYIKVVNEVACLLNLRNRKQNLRRKGRKKYIIHFTPGK